MMATRVLVIVALLGAGSVGLDALSRPDRLVVHEWGTFTALQDMNGEAIGGINTDDEPVPAFVHRVADNRYVLIDTNTVFPPGFFQGAPRCHPDVTLRLETPVTYFYSQGKPGTAQTIDVKASFRGGWLTEYYPQAVAVAPGVTSSGFSFGPITSQTTGTLSWNDIQLGVDSAGPATDAHVWTAPRAVDAVQIRANGESERYLFYRGVGHVDAPLRVVTRDERDVLEVRSGNHLPSGQSTISRLWLVDVREDGTAVFKEAGPIVVDPNREKVHHSFDAKFAEGDYAVANLSTLRLRMKSALMREGLFADEAEAMLNTWELSYFKSAGTRLFFSVPQSWTDAVLPLDISVPADVTRVMIGRIEIVTARQREQLAKLAVEARDLDWTSLLGTLRELSSTHLVRTTSDLARLEEGSADRSALPQVYRTYLDLGRFRNALVLHELKQQPNPALQSFVDKLGLGAYDVGAASGRV